MTLELRAPWPWFGSKQLAADEVWKALGNVRTYVEPFFGSGAVLLNRPKAHLRTRENVETGNDLDGYISNFWRAVKAYPDEVYRHAAHPIHELDLHARHKWLIERRESLVQQLEADPDWCDPKAAGWWAWGLCAWIGDGWCDKPYRKLPALGGNAGRGLHSRTLAPVLPDLLQALADRLEGVRFACGDWERVLGESTLLAGGGGFLGGAFLDPPYATGSMDYTAGGTGTDLSARVRAWCRENGTNPKLRIVIAGYDDEHAELESVGWTRVAWKSRRGYAARDDDAAEGRKDEGVGHSRERLWLSPHCIRGNGSLFDRV